MARVRWQSKHVEIWHGDAREVAAQQEPGSFSLAILDGPYGMNKAAWDRMKVRDLPDWYAPHLDDVGRLCGPSATLYLWNTAEGWATLHPGIVARWWSFVGMIVWCKGRSGAMLTDAVWPEAGEYCAYYVRGEPAARAGECRTNQWRTSPAMFDRETMKSGRMSRPMPNSANPHRERLHPCQKPLAFAERMVRASTRPGERIWAPFGGTCREAVAVETMARKDPAEARYCVTAEIDEDGRGYLDAVCRQLDGHGIAPPDPRQPALF